MDKLRHDYPGLLRERLPSGNFRYRVRVEGNKNRRIRLLIGPEDPQFIEHYLSARAGVAPSAEYTKLFVPQSLDWLIDLYLADFTESVAAGLASQDTLKQRNGLLTRLSNLKDTEGDRYGICAVNMPTKTAFEVRDSMRQTPGAADNMIKAIRAMYKWAIPRKLAASNPADGVGKINLGGKGATPWSIDDLNVYRERHVAGTAAHLCLTLFMFTACRISDAVHLGRSHENVYNGITWLGWQPRKKGSAFVEIPMLPPLLKATRSAKVQGQTYNLTEYGRPFKSPEGLRNRFKKWCLQAGLENRSSHGVRKAAGGLLAVEGCSQYHIMAIHGHTQAKTSEIYTRGVDRRALASEAMDHLGSMDW